MSQNNRELNRPGHSCKLLCISQVILGADMEGGKILKTVILTIKYCKVNSNIITYDWKTNKYVYIRLLE